MLGSPGSTIVTFSNQVSSTTYTIPGRVKYTPLTPLLKYFDSKYGKIIMQQNVR
jgi:hypothetical protein